MDLLLVKTDVANNVYTLEFELGTVGVILEELFHDFGYPEINVGGDILEEEVVIHKQGDKFIKLSELPLKRAFGEAILGDKAERIAKAYEKTIEARVLEAVTELKTKTDDFSGIREVKI